ncbi:MAG: hypothetical protein Q9227_009371 [Pyrenula ochraceoflavens]
MNSPNPSTALAKRPLSEVMPPPPPPKRIKRPPKVLDEDDYTDALSQIIARDFFPGLVESQTQKEYLDALESNDPAWIASAGDKLTQAMTPGPKSRQKNTRLSAESTPGRVLGLGNSTPKGWQGATPATTILDQTAEDEDKSEPAIDTSKLSLSAFQAKYTSEDNESFNALLDKQNLKRREKYAYLWNNNKIPAPRQIAQYAREAKLLKASEENNSNSSNDKALALTTGASSSRPARPDAWNSQPNNTFMFQPPGIEDSNLETVAEQRASESRAAPKQTIYQNTRLPPPPLASDPSQQRRPPSPTPSSSINAAISGHPHRRSTASSTIAEDDFDGSATPRVNGYAFVDEDEPQPQSQAPAPAPEEPPTYRDLLAGQTGSETPNPFKISENRRREALHHQMVEKTNRGKREKKMMMEKVRTPVPRFASSPMVFRGEREKVEGTPGGQGVRKGGGGGGGMMTPAAQRLLEKVGRTPRAGGGGGNGGEGGGGSGLRNMWTPTPRAKRG